MDRKGKTITQIIKATTKRQEFGKDFSYVVQRTGKAKICFGSTQQRHKMPSTSRLSMKYCPKINDNSFPGKYWTDLGFLVKRPISCRGTVLGGRTSVRYPSSRDDPTLAPNKYQLRSPKPTRVPAFKRRPSNKPADVHVVGPGFYPIPTDKKSMNFLYSFGSYKKLVPAVAMKCRPINPDVCERCKKLPVGDYWTLTPMITWIEAKEQSEADLNQKYLCRPCYEKERKKPRIFRKADMTRFTKVRGCSQVHCHDGCEAKLFLVPPRDIAKIQVKEAYLAQYFM